MNGTVDLVRCGSERHCRLGPVWPGTSEDPLAEEMQLLRKKMTVSERVSRLAAHFGSTILHTLSEEDVARHKG